MGCTSSTEIRTDPHTGKETKKKRLGGAYPGQRRPQHQPYAPPPEAFQGGNTATAHFVAYGGGNAMTCHPAVSGGPAKQFMEVTLPKGVKPGDTIHIQSPSGETNAIIVPPGFGPGSTFTVKFADETSQAPTQKPTSDNYYSTNNNNNTQPSTPPPDQGADDGFATGFNNPHWRPTAAATAVHEPEVTVSPWSASSYGGGSYPTATATPVYTPQYSAPPSYPSK